MRDYGSPGGYFSADSAVRRIGGESVLMLGGGRALLMQAAHPLVASGIAEHSRYRDDPSHRLARTMTALYTVVFGSRAEADRAGEAVRAIHAHVAGRLPEGVGRFPAGTPYAAGDPELMLWVHATLVDTGLVVHERLVGALSERDRDGFVADMALVARVFGLPDGLAPTSFAAFSRYLEERLASGDLVVGRQAREVADAVLRPRMRPPLRTAAAALARASASMLPEPIRGQYGVRLPAAERAALRTTEHAVRQLVLPSLPARLRLMVAGDRPGAAFALLRALAG